MQTYLVGLFIVTFVDAKIENYEVIDLSDILNVDYMPGSLLVLENPEEPKDYNNDSTSVVDHRGTFDSAFATMGYHRKMMNEYLCRSYVSEQIITEMKSTRIRRRLGNPAESNVNIGTGNKINFSLKDNLLDDEGSSNYKEWLKKSATLQDIYRHYDSAQSRETPESGRDGEDEVNEDFDGHVTGYGYQQPQPANSPSKLGHSGTGGGYSYHGYPSGGMHSVGGGGGLYGGSSGYGTGGFYYGGHGDHVMFSGGGSGHGYGGGHEHSPKHHGSHDDKDKLADLFDIALTALAYLSFGMFIIQVIMCISMAGTTTAPIMTMMPMSLNPTGAETGGMMIGGGGGMSGGGAGNGGNTNGGGITGGNNGGTGGEGTADDGMAGGNTGDGNDGGDGNGGATGVGDGETAGGDGNDDNGDADGDIDGNKRISINGESNEVDIDGSRINTTSANWIEVSMTGDGNGEEDTVWGDTGYGEGWGDWVKIDGTTDHRKLKTIVTGSAGTGGTGGTGAAATGGTGDTGEGRDGIRQKRIRRDIPVITQPNNEALNELAKKILISIEAALIAHQDEGNCLRKTLCENNVYSRNLDSNQKYWIPVWSLGMSWLSGRLVQTVPRATSMLDSLKASLLGLGNADCELLYNNCDLASERKKRQRRRKRSTRRS